MYKTLVELCFYIFDDIENVEAINFISKETSISERNLD